MQIEVLLTGIGGQGVQLCAKALALAAVGEGRQAMLSAHYGGEMRGGQTEASVVVADRELRALPILPSAWSGFVMHPRYWEPVRSRLRPGGLVVTNSTLAPASELGGPPATVVEIPAGELATGLGAPMSAGFVLLGAYCAATGLASTDSLVEAMRKLVPPYRTQHVAANEAALRAGAGAVPAVVVPAWEGGGSAGPAASPAGSVAR